MQQICYEHLWQQNFVLWSRIYPLQHICNILFHVQYDYPIENRLMAKNNHFRMFSEYRRRYWCLLFSYFFANTCGFWSPLSSEEKSKDFLGILIICYCFSAEKYVFQLVYRRFVTMGYTHHMWMWAKFFTELL